MRLQLARSLMIMVIGYTAAFYFAGAAIKPGYSQMSNFISEYNATGTAYATILTYAGFAAVTFLLAAFLLTVRPFVRVSGISRVGLLLLWAAPLGFLQAAVFPCDAGCPLEGSSSQDMHNLLSVVSYLLTGLAMILLSRAPVLAAEAPWARHFVLAAGIAWIVMFGVMLMPEMVFARGLVQRSLDVLLAVTLLIVAFVLAKPRPVAAG